MRGGEGGRAEEEWPMIAEEIVAARERYRHDGFYLCPEPVIPAETVHQTR